MADDVTLPGTGAKVATEELAGNRHAQIVLAGAKPTNLLALFTPATAGGYAAGEVMGAQVLITDVPTGTYLVRSLAILSADGSDVPKALVASYGNPVDSTPPTLDGDGDTWVPDALGSLGNLAAFGGAGDVYAWSGLTATTGTLRRAVPSVPTLWTVLSDGAGGVLADLSLIVVALESTVVDLTAGLIVSVELERVAAAADATAYTSF